MTQIRLIAIRLSFLILFSLVASCLTRADEPTAEELQYFEKEVRPLLANHCYSCHSAKAKKLQANLLVDSRDALIRGGDSGEAVVPGDAKASLLIEAVHYESYEMPPKGKLAAKDIQTLERWVNMGAPWPKEVAPTKNIPEAKFDLDSRKAQHWVWQPIRSPDVPDVSFKQWPRNELDHFVLTRLEQNNLQPSADTDRTALLRRLYFDLIGLPPTPEQAAEFLNDTSPQATSRLVDQLLASPHFGERWGRHWLDLVRYSESRGHEFDNDSPNAYQYRDYIIRALNADVPYDQLVREHIAGDLLEVPRMNPEHGFNESILGTGYWFLGEWVHSPVDIRKDEADRFDNMIDVMSKTFLGVTVSCARCHDHKFDAISTADYYSLSGFLQSSDYRQVRFESLEHNRLIAGQLTTLDAGYQQKIAKALLMAGVKLPKPTPIDEEAALQVVVDYGTISPSEYLQDGFIFGEQPRLAGEAFLIGVDGKPTLRFAPNSVAASDLFWDGLESVTERGVKDQSGLAKLPRSGRTLRTPTFELTQGNVACRVRGTGHVVACVDSHRLIAGPLHGQTIKAIGPDDDWAELNLDRYVGHRIHLEFTPAEDAQLEVLWVTQGATQETRQKLMAWETSVANSVAKYAKAAELAESGLAEDLSRLVGEWFDERSILQAKIMRRSRLAMAMLDGTGEDGHVLIRGDSSNPGDIEPRHFLTALTGNQEMVIKSGSGRLELARQINDSANPLTSRVIVNRIWHYLMGRGIVPTTDDFGVLGQRPTHPELLDHLATRFTGKPIPVGLKSEVNHSDPQSIKQMIRYIVLSRTYQMSSSFDAAAIKADPKNLLWHHRPPKRLEGEIIRDALLSMSGRLDATQFGESVPVHLTSFMDGRGRPAESGPLDGAGRRSIYTAVRRNFLSPFMLTFDTPAPFSTMGRRNVSNVPAQALILMNDKMVVEQAKEWARRAVKQNSTAATRVDWMYQSAFARQPTNREKIVAVKFVTAQANRRDVEKNDIELWADFAHALINTKEFIFLR